MTDSGAPLFIERQSFPRIWFLLSCLVSLFILTIKFNELGWMHPQFYLSAFVMLAVNLLLGLSRLNTVIGRGMITYRFVPFHFTDRKIALGEIDQVFVRKYRPLMEYGGWGLRWSLNGKAVNVRGNNGIQIVLKNGSRILIGTSQPEAASKALERFLSGSVA